MNRSGAVYQILAVLFVVALLWVGLGTSANSTAIGVIGPLTGTAAPYGLSQRNGVRLAIEQINANGGLNRRPIEAVYVDDANDKIKAAEAAKDLIYQRGVVAIIGAITSDNTMNVQRICEKAEVPLLTAISTNPFITRVNFRYSFRCLSDDDIQADTLARYTVQTMRLTRVAIVHDSNKYGSQGARTYKGIAERMGQSIVANESYEGGTMNFRESLEKIRQLNPDGLLIWGLVRESALLARQAREMGITATIFGGDGMAPTAFLDLAGGAAEGTVLTYPFNPMRGGEKTRGFLEAFRKRYDSEADSFAAHSYDAMMLIFEAMKSGGDDPRRVRDALAGFVGYEGVTGRGGFDPTGNETRPVELAKVKDGRFVAIQGGNAQ